MHRTIIRRTCFCIVIVVLVLVSGSSGQRRRPLPPPPTGIPVEPTLPAPEPKPVQRLDTFTMEREAKELSALAASVPGDVEQLKKGLLPKDAVAKLKRIEKLSRQLRGQVRP